ncbi:hypothetical protein KIW84_010278 [Lathyrus oleraceus]|uniref:RecA-like N-terminal domain-containing protein n=1 Tax=Pisum sativum TaxID=3888 RepID=A0A9D4YJM1_PEA|nr:hypothetical protein KIW84_010278 [Pisum sativum]
MDQILSTFGKESIMWLGHSVSPKSALAVSTDSFALDIVLGIFGLTKGHVMEILGPEASRKKILLGMYESKFITILIVVSTRKTKIRDHLRSSSPNTHRLKNNEHQQYIDPGRLLLPFVVSSSRVRTNFVSVLELDLVRNVNLISIVRVRQNYELFVQA